MDIHNWAVPKKTGGIMFIRAGLIQYGLTLLCCSLSSSLLAQDLDIRYMQGMAGVLDAGDAWQIDDGADASSYVADIDKMIYGGGAVHLSHMDGAFQYGVETGGLVSFHADTSSFVKVDDGATVAVKVESSLWLVDVSLGGFVSYSVGEHFRLYASAGPSVIYGSLSIDDDEIEPTPYDNGANTITFSPNSRESDFQIGLYARAGFEFILTNGITFGASVRQVDSELDFGDSGEIDLNHPQYFLTVGKKY